MAGSVTSTTKQTLMEIQPQHKTGCNHLPDTGRKGPVVSLSSVVKLSMAWHGMQLYTARWIQAPSHKVGEIVDLPLSTGQ